MANNRLIHASSPYLLQHADNPVDWQEWGEEALSTAKREGKPILLSIGYSSCHWCHVMEHESFEDKDIAALMNEHFICIKVDREERPDIDQLYMDAVQAMGIGGGWPLNVFLTPDQSPFYAGTYFRPVQWSRLLHEVARAYRERREEVETAADDLRKFLNEVQLTGSDSELEITTLIRAMADGIRSQYDPLHGGQDKAPRFPMPSIWQFLLRSGSDASPEMVSNTLTRMALGGICDQVGGGFARYSVDGRWFVPHFEKMLYDNGQLLTLYAEAFCKMRDPLFEEVIRHLIDWLHRDMQHPDGGFYSALDADSEGEEGQFYVWTTQDLAEALGARAGTYASYFGCTQEGNWEHGKNILTGKPLNQRPADWRAGIRQMLFFREQRVRPALDDKVITAWNGMTIVGLVQASLALGNEQWLLSAEQAFRFLRLRLTDEHKIYRSFRSHAPSTEGFLDDYVWYIKAALALYDVTFNDGYLREGLRRLEYVLDAFADSEHPLFFYTSRHAEALVARRKEIFDNVIPCSNSVLADVLLRAGRLTGKEDWVDQVRNMAGCVRRHMTESPAYMCGWGSVACQLDRDMHVVVIAGPDPAAVRKSLGRQLLPFSLFVSSGNDTARLKLEILLPVIQDKKTVNDKPTFYVCSSRGCLPPVHTLPELQEQLSGG